jgi:hypothetical protein
MDGRLDRNGNGVGTKYYRNGNTYEGNWIQNKWHGKGIMYYENGEVEEGTFKDGRLWTGKIIRQNGHVDEVLNGKQNRYVWAAAGMPD